MKNVNEVLNELYDSGVGDAVVDRTVGTLVKVTIPGFGTAIGIGCFDDNHKLHGLYTFSDVDGKLIHHTVVFGGLTLESAIIEYHYMPTYDDTIVRQSGIMVPTENPHVSYIGEFSMTLAALSGNPDYKYTLWCRKGLAEPWYKLMQITFDDALSRVLIDVNDPYRVITVFDQISLNGIDTDGKFETPAKAGYLVDVSWKCEQFKKIDEDEVALIKDSRDYILKTIRETARI